MWVGGGPPLLQGSGKASQGSGVFTGAGEEGQSSKAEETAWAEALRKEQLVPGETDHTEN